MQEEKQPYILIVEDDRSFAEILAMKLGVEGYRSEIAPDGKKGLEVIRNLHPDLVLLDLMMPEMDGYQVLEALKADVDAIVSQTPVIVISNLGQPVEISRAIQLGIKDYFIKSTFDPDQVVAKIRKQLTKEAPPELVVPTTLPPVGSGTKKTKLLIVEDDKFLRDLEAQKLAKDTIEVFAAMDGEQGIQMIEKERPDIVLLDILLPGIDGFEVLTRMRQNPLLANISVIMLSNFGQREDIERAQKLGAVKFLIKANYTLDEIVNEVDDVVKKRNG